MTNASEPHQPGEVIDRLTDPDPFVLPRRVKQRVRCCSHQGCGNHEEVKYLWIDLTLHQPEPGQARLSLDNWLGVVDEAASLGASLVVFSVADSPSIFPDVWTICRWAVENYAMTAGFHSRSGLLNESDVAAFRELGLANCVLFVAPEHRVRVSELEQQGLKVMPSHPDVHERHSMCEMPSEMIYVDPEGVLYTCGMVKRNQDYALGHILEKKLNQVVQDPSLPHSVPEQAAHDDHGCDGCPPLVARHLIQGKA